MHVQHQKGIPATIAIYPIDDHETYALKKKRKKEKKNKKLGYQSLLWLLPLE